MELGQTWVDTELETHSAEHENKKTILQPSQPDARLDALLP